MKYCTRCGAQLQDNATACYNCGYMERENSSTDKRSKGLVVTVIVLAVLATASVAFMLVRVLGKQEITAEDFGFDDNEQYIAESQDSGRETGTGTGMETAVIPSDDAIIQDEEQSSQHSDDSNVFLPTESEQNLTAEVDYYDIVVGYDSSGITEQQAYTIFGEPITRDTVDYEQGTYIELRYETFILRFLFMGNETQPCDIIEVFGQGQIDICGLAPGMSPSEVNNTLQNTMFSLYYQESDGSYFAYEDTTSGHVLLVYFDGDTAIDFMVYYNP